MCELVRLWRKPTSTFRGRPETCARGDLGYLHVLVEDATTAKAALEQAGLEVAAVHDVKVIPIPDRPGAIAETCRKFSDEGEHLEVIYMAGNALVVGTESMRREIAGRRMGEARYD